MQRNPPKRLLDLGDQEHDPLIHFGTVFDCRGYKAPSAVAFSEIERDRGGFDNYDIAVDENRRFAEWVDGTEFRLLKFTSQDIDGVLVDILAIDPTTISRNLKQLEKDGLAKVGKIPSDKRARVVRLTPKGRNMLAAALPLWRSAHQDVMKRLGSKAVCN